MGWLKIVHEWLRGFSRADLEEAVAVMINGWHTPGRYMPLYDRLSHRQRRAFLFYAKNAPITFQAVISAQIAAKRQ